MGVTALSFILLPLCLIWAARPIRLLQLLLVAAILEAAAAFVIGGLGFQPPLVPALVFIGFVTLQMLLGVGYPGQQRALRVLQPFILVALWGVIGSFLLPRFLEGRVFVWPQKALPPFVLSPLEPSASNVTQDFYLIINTILLVLATIYLTRSRVDLKSLIHAYFIGGFLAAGIAVWQFASKLAGVPYPDSFFYSNPGWAILTGQAIGAIPRINGTFSEPSALGGYMAAAACSTGWLLMQGHRDKIIRALFLVALAGVLLSTSTTGFATLAVAAAGVGAFALLSGSIRMISGAMRIALPMTLLLGVLFMTASIVQPEVITGIGAVIDSVVTKQDSSSYEDRTSYDVDSLQVALDSFGLGAGWGSNRSSSLIPGLLAGVGVPGVLGLLWFAAGVRRQVRRARRLAPTRDQLLVIDGSCGAITGFVIAAVISAPTISSVGFFMLLALLIAATVRVELDAAARTRAAMPRVPALLARRPVPQPAQRATRSP
jgi:hypothetical protein